MPPQEGAAQPEATGAAGSGPEALACTLCRTRKLKCDRVRPVCTRCARATTECVYPESRRKPAFKRRNVRELEARLAQVEGLLQRGEAGPAPPEPAPEPSLADEPMSNIDFGFSDFAVEPETVWQAQMTAFDTDFLPERPGAAPQPSVPVMGLEFSDELKQRESMGKELMSLGLLEPLPPFEVMEDLNRIFFLRQYHFIPVIHQARYTHAFYSAPHKRPPMCLQYAIWAMASNGHEKYGGYHEAFYQRARRYLDSDELRGYGEHFITISHAQAWALIATDEARLMYFTRASMSAARCVRLVHMMGLHRLDGPDEEGPPTLAPPANWADLEERRRTFWGAFCIDAHASISTGWPNLIDTSEVTTHLPASEEAFSQGHEEASFPLTEAFKGANYSTFAGAIIVCHVFVQILKHVHRPRVDDYPEDVDYGNFWKRHRDLDNTLSSAFMFLPDRFRLPKNIRDPVAVHTNLNLHASVICLHHGSLDMIEKHNLPEQLKITSKGRLKAAADEVVNIVRLTSHISSGYKSPLIALSMYCAISVYLSEAMEHQECGLSPESQANLEFVVRAMEAVSRDHIITRAFLQQVCLDVERNGLAPIVRLPDLRKYEAIVASCSSNIPLLARSRIAKHSKIAPVLPGRLPLGKPEGTAPNLEKMLNGVGQDGARTVMHHGQACPTPTAAAAHMLSNPLAGAAGAAQADRQRKGEWMSKIMPLGDIGQVVEEDRREESGSSANKRRRTEPEIGPTGAPPIVGPDNVPACMSTSPLTTANTGPSHASQKFNTQHKEATGRPSSNPRSGSGSGSGGGGGGGNGGGIGGPSSATFASVFRRSSQTTTLSSSGPNPPLSPSIRSQRVALPHRRSPHSSARNTPNRSGGSSSTTPSAGVDSETTAPVDQGIGGAPLDDDTYPFGGVSDVIMQVVFGNQNGANDDPWSLLSDLAWDQGGGSGDGG